MPDRERAICQRLREFRATTRLKRIAFADEIGLTAGYVANLEHGRAPVRWGVARKVALRFRLSLEWLATGVEKMHSLLDISKRIPASDAELFSKVWDAHMEPNWASWTAVLDLQRRESFVYEPLPLGIPVEELLWLGMRREFDYQARRLPQDERIAVLQRLDPIVAQSLQTMIAEIAAEKEDLTEKVNALTTKRVEYVLPKLIDRIREATKERGGKAALAAWLGVHRQCVTDWLSGKQKPNGETTLRLLHWVEAEERKQQGPGGVISTTGAKTQQWKVTNEKPKSGPAKP